MIIQKAVPGRLPTEPKVSTADLDDFEAYIARQVRGREGDERDDLEAYLRTYPGRSVADWKGKALTAPVDALPWEKPWHKLNRDEVRDAATRSLARDLPLNIRKAAGRDPGLIWNDYARKYRARLATDPAHEMGGGTETSCMVGDGPAPKSTALSKVQFPHEF